MFDPLYKVIDGTGLNNDKVFSIGPHQPDKGRTDAWVISFLSEYSQFSTSQLPTVPNIQAWYDAFYLAAYSMVAVGEAHHRREHGGNAPADAAPGGTYLHEHRGHPEGLRASAVGQGIDLSGLSGDMNLDVRTVRRKLQCQGQLREHATRQNTTSSTPPAPRYRNGQLHGTLKCDGK